MLRIKLMPFGKKHSHTYRIVVVEGKSKITGHPAATLGHYSPPSAPVVDQTKLKVWLTQGAQPSETIRQLLKL